MSKLERRNFKTKAHLAASKKEAQEVMNYIIFEDGNLVATDGHILIVQPLHGHGFSHEEIDHLEGKAIHREAFQDILRYTNIQVGASGIKCKKGKIVVVFPLETLEKQCGSQYVNYKAVIPDSSNVSSMDYIGFDLNILTRVKDLTLNLDGKVLINLFGRNRQTILQGIGVDEQIVVMPLRT